MQNQRIFMFPGQGSQAPGMAAGWLESAAARAVLEEANEALKLDLGALMAPEADADVLKATQNAQPCLLVVGLMAAAALQEETGKLLAGGALAVAGHSLGEYTAVAAAGGLSVHDAVALVRLRGEAMAQAAPGGMSAVLGVTPEVLEGALKGQEGVWLANDNCDGQAVIAGTLEQLEAGEAACKAAGAKRVLRLPVSGAFHTPLQQAAAEAVGGWLKAHTLAPLKFKCLMNYTAQYHENEQEIKDNLVKQITGRVRWREAMMQAAASGATEAIELGCGKVLAGLAPRCDSRLSAQSLTGREELLRWLETQQG